MIARSETEAPIATSAAVSATGSRTTRWLGFACLVGLAVLLVLAFVLTNPHETQLDSVRLLYVHVPVAIMTYVAFTITAIAGVMVLWKRSTWWDVAAAASAEIGVLFCALMLITGAIWGRPTWNTWWEWGDARIMTSLVLLLIFIGYLAYRRSVPDRESRARRSAVIGIIGASNMVIVNRSVEWWANRTLHQKSTLAEGRMEDLTLFSLMFGMVVFAGILAWMLIHRFRIGWLEYQIETHGLQAAIAERRAQATAGVREAVQMPSMNPGSTQ